ncbi:MAG: 4-alpha-glucanotransferase, partial [Actinobacteria bacterium]|nr:4-alpha-glucanotransferase [Actinomycetota bacterium]
MTGRRREASRPTLVALLRALGAPLDGRGDIVAALRMRRLEQWRRPLEPVAVAWEGRMPALGLRLPARLAARRLRCRIELEDGGETVSWTLERDRAQAGRTDVEGVAFVER